MASIKGQVAIAQPRPFSLLALPVFIWGVNLQARLRCHISPFNTRTTDNPKGRRTHHSIKSFRYLLKNVVTYNYVSRVAYTKSRPAYKQTEPVLSLQKRGDVNAYLPRRVSSSPDIVNGERATQRLTTI